MIKCNIEVNYYEDVVYGDDKLTHSYTEYVLNFPVLPSPGEILCINPDRYSTRVLEVLKINYKTEIYDKHNCTDRLPEVEVVIVVKEVK